MNQIKKKFTYTFVTDIVLITPWFKDVFVEILQAPGNATTVSVATGTTWVAYVMCRDALCEDHDYKVHQAVGIHLEGQTNY